MKKITMIGTFQRLLNISGSKGFCPALFQWQRTMVNGLANSILKQKTENFGPLSIQSIRNQFCIESPKNENQIVGLPKDSHPYCTMRCFE